MIRADSLWPILAAISNSTTGAGTSDDPQSDWAPTLDGRMLWPVELADLDGRSLAARIVREPGLWLACAGVQIEDDAGDPGPLHQELARLDVDTVFQVALRMARRMGGAGVLLLPEPAQPLDRPLDLTRIQGLRGLVPYSGYHLRVLERDQRLDSPRRGKPLWYQIDGRSGNLATDERAYWSTPIHWSHVLDFYGHYIDEPELLVGWYGEWPAVSVLQLCWMELRDYMAGRHNAAAAARRASTFLMSFPDYEAKKLFDADNFAELLQTVSAKLGVNNTLYGMPGMKLDVASLQTSGFEAFAKDDRIALASAADPGFPVEVLFQPENGSVFQGSGYAEIWKTRLTGLFRASYAQPYRRLHRILGPIVYERTPRLERVEPGDFSAPTDNDRMEARLLGAQEVKTLMEGGLDVREAAVRGRYSGRWTASLPAVPVRLVAASTAQQPTAPTPPGEEHVTTPSDIPDDTSAADFAAQMTAHGFATCEHGKSNRCPICRIERVRAVEKGPDGTPIYPVRWRAIGGRADAGGLAPLPLAAPPTPNRDPHPYAGALSFRGLPLLIETAAGQARSGTDPDGKAWSVVMPWHYGEIPGTLGLDGDPVDVMVGPDPSADEVFVLHLRRPGQARQDEDKAYLGFATVEDALAAFRAAYIRQDIFRGVTRWSWASFRDYVTDPSHHKISLDAPPGSGLAERRPTRGSGRADGG